MMQPLVSRKAIAAFGVGALIALGAPQAYAGGGLAIGKVAGDLTERFSKATDPQIPLKTPTPTLEYKPPEPAPGGTQTWSTGHVNGASPPRESLPNTFNRNAGDNAASDNLTDMFNRTRRAFD